VVAFSEPIRLDLVRDETLFPEVDGEKVSLTVSTFENLLVLRPELPYPAFPPESQIQSPRGGPDCSMHFHLFKNLSFSKFQDQPRKKVM